MRIYLLDIHKTNSLLLDDFGKLSAQKHSIMSFSWRNYKSVKKSQLDVGETFNDISSAAYTSAINIFYKKEQKLKSAGEGCKWVPTLP